MSNLAVSDSRPTSGRMKIKENFLEEKPMRIQVREPYLADLRKTKDFDKV